MSYNDVYKLRLDRYGLNYQQRIQTEREKTFEKLLLKSPYRIDFQYENETHPALLEKYRQDTLQTLQYLLTRIDLNIEPGTILMLPNKDAELRPWMIFYLECIKASGYNRYIVLKMNQEITMTAKDGSTQTMYAYLHGKGDTTLRNTDVSKSIIYEQDENSFYLITPRNDFIKKDLYVEVGEEPFKQSFRTMGFDIWSTQGVEYVTLDPVYKYDQTPSPAKSTGDLDTDFYWLNSN